jgi:hypothetical protein
MKKFVLLAAGIAIGFAAAQIDQPRGSGVDAARNAWAADGNKRIRKITSASTLAGSVQCYTDGNGGDARFENLAAPSINAERKIYVADIGNNRIRKIRY